MGQVFLPLLSSSMQIDFVRELVREIDDRDTIHIVQGGLYQTAFLFEQGGDSSDENGICCAGGSVCGYPGICNPEFPAAGIRVLERKGIEGIRKTFARESLRRCED